MAKHAKVAKKQMKPKDKKHRYKEKKIDISKIFLLIFIFGIIISTYEIIDWLNNNKRNSEIINDIKEAVEVEIIEDEESNKYNVDFEKLKDTNSDTVGWLKVEGTSVEYPVVQGNNNSFYLNHSFTKEYNAAGWIFADYTNNFNKMDRNTVIYGHNRRDGSMFYTLKDVLKKEWYKDETKRKIIFITESGENIYETFSVYQTEAETYYLTTKFSSDAEYKKFLNTIKKRSIEDFNVEVNENDEILTLSTCANNNKYRVVLHAKKITK